MSFAHTRRHRLSLIAVLSVGVASIALGQSDTLHVECPITADATLLTLEGAARESNTGGAQQLQAAAGKSFVLLRADLSAIRGTVVTKATLRLHRVSDLLVRAGISTVAGGAGWDEGTGAPSAIQPGAVCYQYAAHARQAEQAQWWAGPGSDFSDVIFGNGGSRWTSTVPAFDKETLWYEIDIPVEMVQAMAQGLQTPSLCICDDFGRGQTIPTFSSHESKHSPVLIIEAERKPPQPSPVPENVRAHRDDLGREWLTFDAPNALGFDIYLSPRPVKASQLEEADRLAPWSLPAPGDPPRRTLLSLYRHEKHRFAGVRSMHLGDTWSDLVWIALPEMASSAKYPTLPDLPRFDLPGTPTEPFTLDAYSALSEDGRWIRTAGKTWWRPTHGPIDLEAGRNEFTAFQIVLAGKPGTYVVRLVGWQSPGLTEPIPQAHLFEQRYVAARLGHEKYCPEIAVPIEFGQPLPLDLLTASAATQPATQPTRRKVAQALWLEVYVPHKAAPGQWTNRLVVLRNGTAVLDMPLHLTVRDATLPNTLGYQVSLQTNRLPNWAQDTPTDSAIRPVLEGLHRAAHRHRATLAVVPHNADDPLRAALTPKFERDENNIKFDWYQWDRTLGPYLSGAAFRDLPREAVPIAHMILPICEDWPVAMKYERAPRRAPLAQKYHYRPTYTEPRPGIGTNPPADSYMRWPIEAAMTNLDRDAIGHAIRAFATHLSDQGWTDTKFQLYLASGVRGGEASWWFLRNPQTFDDHLALRFFYEIYNHAVEQIDKPTITLRADLAVPEWSRGTLRGLLDRTIVGDALLQKNRLVMGWPQQFPSPWYSGGATPPELGWSRAVSLCWSTRLAGARGIVIDNAVSSNSNNGVATDGALLLSSDAYDDAPPVSLRLKAYCLGQQDIEWIDAWLDAKAKSGVPEPRALVSIARLLANRAGARPTQTGALWPALELPGRLDTVALEEVRRGLRASIVDD